MGEADPHLGMASLKFTFDPLNKDLHAILEEGQEAPVIFNFKFKLQKKMYSMQTGLQLTTYSM